MATPKVRIYELTKELGLKSWKDLADVLESKYGIAVKSHSSTIDQDLANKVAAEFKGQGAAVESAAPATQPKPAAKAEPAPSQPKEAMPVAQAKPAPSTPVKPTPQAQKPFQGQQPASAPQRHVPPTPKAPEKPRTDDRGGARPAAAPAASGAPQREERKGPADAGRPSFQKAPEPADHGNKQVQVAQRQKQAAATTVTAPPEPEAQVVQIEAPLSIAELAQKLQKRETELIRHLFMKGVMVTVNQTMQVEDALTLAKEMGFEAIGPEKRPEMDRTAAPEVKIRQAKGKHLRPRFPVVSIMGHVDHGKTSLLDAIRETRHRIVDTEAGGITQSIGAYTVEKDDQKVVFIDTPGHEAFTAMRMRGAQATDIAILVVAADDGVMPQTIEAINHAKAANIPIIVAINKIDKADADPDRVLVQLSDHGLTAEKWGGDTITVEVSALQKLGLDDLLEMITLVSELQELKADSTVPAEGVVIESRLDKGKGPVATVLVQNGTLHVGENIIMNAVGGRIRALISDTGERIKSAGPSTPVEILGLNDVPQAGESFAVVRNDKEFKRLLQQRQSQEKDLRHASKVAAPGLMSDKESERKDFYLIVKADTHGSVEAVTSALLQLATEEVSVHILHSATGDVSEADVLLASASNAIIIAFNVKEEANAQKAAVDRSIQVRSYDIIYHVVEDMEKLMLGLLSPETEELEIGSAEVRQIFTFGKTSIAGSYVLDGKVVRNALSRVFRNGKKLYEGPLNNLKRFKEDAREVAAGYECGISYDRFNDLQPGDVIRVFQLKEVERTSL